MVAFDTERKAAAVQAWRDAAQLWRRGREFGDDRQHRAAENRKLVKPSPLNRLMVPLNRHH